MWIPLLFADICWRARSCCGWWGTESCIWAVWRTCLCQNSCWQRVWLCPVYSQVAIASRIHLYVTFLCSGLGYFQHFCGSVICAVNLGFCRASAEEALQRLHGTVIGSQSVRLSWGRSPTSKQTSQDVSLLSCFVSPLLIWSLSAKSDNVCDLSLHKIVVLIKFRGIVSPLHLQATRVVALNHVNNTFIPLWYLCGSVQMLLLHIIVILNLIASSCWSLKFTWLMITFRVGSVTCRLGTTGP